MRDASVIKSIEQAIGPFKTGEVYAVAGRPGIGKTTLLSALSADWPVSGIYVAECLYMKDLPALESYFSHFDISPGGALFLTDFTFLLQRLEGSSRTVYSQGFRLLKKLAEKYSATVFVEVHLRREPDASMPMPLPQLRWLVRPSIQLRYTACIMLLFRYDYYSSDVNDERLYLFCHTNSVEEPKIVPLAWKMKSVQRPYADGLVDPPAGLPGSEE